MNNVQINVAGDLHVHNACCSSPRVHYEHSAEWGAIALFAAERLLHGVATLLLGVGWLALQIARGGLWGVARVSSGVLRLERRLSGGPTRLVSIGPGERVDELKQLESDYDYAE